MISVLYVVLYLVSCTIHWYFIQCNWSTTV